MRPYYEQGGITIYHARCDDVLPILDRATVDLVITSPPYNRGDMAGGLANLTGGYSSYADALPHEHYVAWQREVLRECWRVVSDAGAIFYNHRPRITDGNVWLPLELNPGLPLRQVIIWARELGVNWSPTFYMPTHEWVMLFARPAFRLGSKSESHCGDVWTIRPEHRDLGHPAPFPLALPMRILTTTSVTSVLDPFMGVGTTLRAAKDVGCRAIGIEMDERYCEIAAKRMSQEVLPLVGVA
jgi:site-specific DNA-methyltransferase (adenine-specific)